MSSSKRIIKKTNTNEKKETVYVDEHFHGEAEGFLEESFEKKKEKIEKELEQWRLERTAEVEKSIDDLIQEGYQKGKETAYQEVFEQVMAENGKKMDQDYDEKINEARRIYQKANSHLVDVEQNLFQYKRRWVEQNEEQLAEIVKLSVEKIMGRSIKVESEELKKILKETLSQSETKNKNIWVRVHPDTKTIIEEKGLSEDKIELIPDPKLRMNDFFVETDNEWIDGTIENKLISFEKKIKDWIEKNEIF